MYTIAIYYNPKGRNPQAYNMWPEGNKRTAIRRARKILRGHWGGRPNGVKVVRASVTNKDQRLIYQASITEDSAQNGERRMIKDEEL